MFLKSAFQRATHVTSAAPIKLISRLSRISCRRARSMAFSSQSSRRSFCSLAAPQLTQTPRRHLPSTATRISGMIFTTQQFHTYTAGRHPHTFCSSRCSHCLCDLLQKSEEPWQGIITFHCSSLPTLLWDRRPTATTAPQTKFALFSWDALQEQTTSLSHAQKEITLVTHTKKTCATTLGVCHRTRTKWRRQKTHLRDVAAKKVRKP